MQKRINIQNKKARFEYEILDQFTSGIVLTGTEIKSIRNSKASIASALNNGVDSQTISSAALGKKEGDREKAGTSVVRSDM